MYLAQECGQKWYRRRSWRRPLFRKLEHKVIQKAELVDFSESQLGLSATFRNVEYEMVYVGWAFGPLMLFK